MGLLTLSEIFLICLSWFLENGDHVYEYLRKNDADSAQPNKDFVRREVQETEETCAENNSEKTWVKLLRNATSGRKYVGAEKILSRNTVITNESSSVHGGLNEQFPLCLSGCIKRQVCSRVILIHLLVNPYVVNGLCNSPFKLDHIGKKILSKLMGEWRLMDELSVLRSIYLLGSGVSSFSVLFACCCFSQ
jgi:hypothetical protein